MALWMAMAEAVERRSHDYLQRYGCTGLQVGAALFGRDRQLHWAGSQGARMLRRCGVRLRPPVVDSR